jgi:cytochrome c oxidase subunit 4
MTKMTDSQADSAPQTSAEQAESAHHVENRIATAIDMEPQPGAQRAQPAHAARPQPNYILIFVFLAVLTAIEVFTAFTIHTQWLKVSALLALAVAKAGLVVAYYMHLRFEKMPLRIIALGPLILVFILASTLLLERTLAR